MNASKFIVLLIVTLTTISCYKPAASNNAKRIDDLVAHFKSKGINVTGKVEKAAEIIGAAEGCAIVVGKERYEVYKYDTDVPERRKDLDRYEKEGLNAMGMRITIIRNGSFILIPSVKAGDDWRKFEAAFKSFGESVPTESSSSSPRVPTSPVTPGASAPKAASIAKELIRLNKAYVIQIGRNGTIDVYEFENLSDKAVDAFKGKFLIYDKFGEVSQSISLEYTETVAPKSKLYLHRLFIDGVMKDEKGEPTSRVLDDGAKECGVTVEQLAVTKKCAFKLVKAVQAE